MPMERPKPAEVESTPDWATPAELKLASLAEASTVARWAGVSGAEEVRPPPTQLLFCAACAVH